MTLQKENIFQKMTPLVRFLICLSIAILVFFIVPKAFGFVFRYVIAWDIFSFFFLLLSWIVILTRTVEQIRKKATEDDGSAIYVTLMVLFSSLAGLLSVLLLMLSQEAAKNPLFIPASLTGMIFSWAMVHSIYIFHYAHEYYAGEEETTGSKKAIGGLDFPKEKKPDYLDFAYFSFVMGCTFQVSDVQITSRVIRRIAFVHSILAFFINTFVVALTINMIGGLIK